MTRMQKVRAEMDLLEEAVTNIDEVLYDLPPENHSCTKLLFVRTILQNQRKWLAERHHVKPGRPVQYKQGAERL